MTYHRGCMPPPFSLDGTRVDEAQEERRVECDMEGNETVIRWCQRAATGWMRGQLPRNTPGICGVAEEKTRVFSFSFFSLEGERKEKKKGCEGMQRGLARWGEKKGAG